MPSLELLSEIEFKQRVLGFMSKVDTAGGAVVFSCYTFSDLLESLYSNRENILQREKTFLKDLEREASASGVLEYTALTKSKDSVFYEANYVSSELCGGEFDRQAVSEYITQSYSAFFLHAQVLSFGMTFYPYDTNDYDELRVFSTQMSIRAVGSREPIEFYTPKKYQQSLRDSELRAVMREFVNDGLFDLHYQPQLELQAPFTLVGCEALLRPRIKASDGSVFNAFETVIQLEKSGWLMGALGLKIIEKACQDIESWKAQGLSVAPVSINISVQQLFIKDFFPSINEILQRYDVDDKDVSFELTETEYAGSNKYFAQNMAALYKKYQLYLDDYGTGHASAEHYLKHDFHGVKLDRSFIIDIDNGSALSDKKGRVIAGLLASPLSYGQKVVVEGIETEGELAHFAELYPQVIGQGYLWSPAVPAEKYSEYLRQGCVPVSKL